MNKQSTKSKLPLRSRVGSGDSSRAAKYAILGFPEKFYVTINLDASLYLEKPMEEVEEVFDREIRAVRIGAFIQMKKLRVEYREKAEKERMRQVERDLMRRSPQRFEIFWGTMADDGTIMVYTDMGKDYLFPTSKNLEEEFYPDHGEETEVSSHKFGTKE